MAASPYGFWTSPITSDLVVANSIRLEQVALDGDAIYWSEFSRRSRDELSSTASAPAGSRNPRRPTTPTLSAFAHAHTSMAAARSPSVTAWSISRTILISGSIARMQAGRRARSPLLQPAPLRMRCGTRMASSTSAGGAWWPRVGPQAQRGAPKTELGDANMAQECETREITAAREDFLVELRGFKPRRSWRCVPVTRAVRERVWAAWSTAEDTISGLALR